MVDRILRQMQNYYLKILISQTKEFKKTFYKLGLWLQWPHEFCKHYDMLFIRETLINDNSKIEIEKLVDFHSISR